MKRFLVLLAAGCVLAPAMVKADLTIETKTDGESQNAYIAPHMFRVNTAEGGAIFRGDKKVLYILNQKEQTYTAMTEEDAKALGAKMKEAMSDMAEALKKVPPEQREAVEKMMSKQNMTGAMAEAKRMVKPTGQTKTINGFPCKEYTVTREDGSTSDVWATELSAANVKSEDLSVFHEFGDFMQTMLPNMNKFEDLIKDYEHPKESDVPGIPILTVEKDKDGKELSRAEMVKIDHGTVDASQFEVPSGLTQKPLEMGPMGGPGGGMGGHRPEHKGMH